MSLFELNRGLAAYFLFLTFLLGASMGSFLHCAAWRYGQGESVLRGRSRCPKCGHILCVPDLIPIFSWLFLRGRCRYCGERVPARYLFSELACGLLFVSVALRFGVGWESVKFLILTAVLFYLTLTDLETMELPGIPMVIAALSWGVLLFTGADPAALFFRGLAGALTVAGVLLALALLLDRILGRESLGGGDVKLVALTGLYFGWDGNLLLIILSCFLGLLFGAAMRARNRPFPFGPAIAAAAWLVMLFGEYALDWYWGLF